MKSNLIVVGLLMVCHASAAAEPTNDDNYAWTVGTDDKGQLVQQVEWLFKDERMTATNCPIWAGTILTIVEERDNRVKVKCDRDNIPNWQQ